SKEAAWPSSSGGYSTVESEPVYQRGVQNSGWRSVPDVAYNATNYAYVDSYDYPNSPLVSGEGTSFGAPQWAALIAIANQGRAVQGLAPLDGPTQTLPLIYQLPDTA